MRALAAVFAFAVLAGCGPSLSLVREQFPDSPHLPPRLEALRHRYPVIIDVVRIGESHEARPILAVRLSGAAKGERSKPALLAIFAEHGDEHDTTALALGMVERLAGQYRSDAQVTSLLDQTELWLIPMMNPDGAHYALSGAVRPSSWRKNRRPTGAATVGVDLNRNWGYAGDSPAPGVLPDHLTDRRSQNYAGDSAFSEPETRAVRDLLLRRDNVRLFVDYHSGGARFLQGGTGCFSSLWAWRSLHPGAAAACDRLIDGFAAAMTDPDDERPGVFVVRRLEDVPAAAQKHAPFYLKPFIPAAFPAARGVSGEYVYGHLGIAAIGVEIFRDDWFFADLPASRERMVDNQLWGLRFLLQALLPKAG